MLQADLMQGQGTVCQPELCVDDYLKMAKNGGVVSKKTTIELE